MDSFLEQMLIDIPADVHLFSVTVLPVAFPCILEGELCSGCGRIYLFVYTLFHLVLILGGKNLIRVTELMHKKENLIN